MNRARILRFTLAALLATGVVAGVAIANESGHENDAAALASAKITLQQAITTAEQQAGGRAVSADLQQERGVSQVEVKVAGQQGVKSVLVNAQTGQVTATHIGDQGDQDND